MSIYLTVLFKRLLKRTVKYGEDFSPVQQLNVKVFDKYSYELDFMFFMFFYLVFFIIKFCIF